MFVNQTCSGYYLWARVPVSLLIVTVDTLNKEMALVGVGDFSRQCEISRNPADMSAVVVRV